MFCVRAGGDDDAEDVRGDDVSLLGSRSADEGVLGECVEEHPVGRIADAPVPAASVPMRLPPMTVFGDGIKRVRRDADPVLAVSGDDVAGPPMPPIVPMMDAVWRR